MQRADVTVRLAEPLDVPVLADIHLEGWRSAHYDTPLRHHLDAHSVESREEIWTKLLAQHEGGARVWVAAIAHVPVAFVATGPMRKPHRRATGVFELYALYQRNSVEGSGTARALLGHAIEDLRQRKANAVYLWSLASNERALQFYERAGWRRVAEESTRYEGKRLDHIVCGYDLCHPFG